MKNNLYKHYKGNLYQVLDIATHTETEEDLVIYKAVDSERIWARPKTMFDEMVDVNGITQKRFELIKEA